MTSSRILLGVIALASISLASSLILSLKSKTKEPIWIGRGTTIAKEHTQTNFYAVGAVTHIKNIGLARTTAANRARAELSKLYKHYLSNLMKNVSGERPSENQLNEHQPIYNIEIVEYWKNDSDNTLYALAHLKFDEHKFVQQMTSNAEPN